MGSNLDFVRNLLIAIVGGLIIFIATQIYIDFYKQPVIRISFNPIDSNDTFFLNQVKLSNIGHSAANNLRLTIHTNASISNYEKTLYSENFTKPKIEGDNHFLVTSTPRFTIGSSVILETLIKPSENFTNYQIFVTFDQNSINSSYVVDKQNQIVTFTNPTDLLRSILDSVVGVVSIITASIGIIAGILSGIIKYRKRRMLDKGP